MRDAAREHRQDRRQHVVSTAAEAIGIEPRDLGARLRAGESMAGVAEAEGVERQAVVDALVAASDGRLDAERAGRIVDAERRPR